jgi:hypothetical protein
MLSLSQTTAIAYRELDRRILLGITKSPAGVNLIPIGHG